MEDAEAWTEEVGHARWYLYNLATGAITDEPDEILGLIRSTPETQRYQELPQETLTDVRKKVEKHIKNTYLKSVMAPVGVKAKLKAWKEISRLTLFWM